MSFPVLSAVPKARFLAASPEIPKEISVVHWDDLDGSQRQNPSGFRAALGVGAPIPASVLRSPELEMLQLVSVGYERVDMDTVHERRITLCNNPGRNSGAVAEHILMSLLYFSHRMGECQRVARSKDYGSLRMGLMDPLLRDLRELTVGVVGFGAIGERFAEIARPLHMRVLYNSRTRRPETEERLNVQFAPFDSLLATADAVVVTLPLTEETHGLFDRAQFQAMKPSSIFVNVGRGAVVNPYALAEALRERWIYAASLDVLHPEPPLPDNPLLHLPEEANERLLLSPHIAGVTHSTWRDMVQGAIDNLAAYARGDEPEHVVARGRTLFPPSGRKRENP